MAMKGTALFIAAMALAATPIAVVLSQDSSVDQELRVPASVAASPRHQQEGQPSHVTRSSHRTEPKARCTSSTTTAPNSCRGLR
jgi:hypothetical protein